MSLYLKLVEYLSGTREFNGRKFWNSLSIFGQLSHAAGCCVWLHRVTEQKLFVIILWESQLWYTLSLSFHIPNFVSIGRIFHYSHRNYCREACPAMSVARSTVLSTKPDFAADCWCSDSFCCRLPLSVTYHTEILKNTIMQTGVELQPLSMHTFVTHVVNSLSLVWLDIFRLQLT